MTLDIISGVLIKMFSDHQPYFFLLNIVQTMDSPPVYVKITKQDKKSIQNFYNEILISNELTSLNDNQDVNPCKLVKYNKSKHKKSKWTTYRYFIGTNFMNDLRLLILIPYNFTYKK